MNVYCRVMFEFNYSVRDIKNSELGEGIVCLGEGNGGKGAGEKEGSGGKGGGKWVKGAGKWGMPTPLSNPSLFCLQLAKSYMYNTDESYCNYPK